MYEIGLGERTFRHCEPNAVVPHECEPSCGFASQDAGSRPSSPSFIHTRSANSSPRNLPILFFFEPLPTAVGLLRPHASGGFWPLAYLCFNDPRLVFSLATGTSQELSPTDRRPREYFCRQEYKQFSDRPRVQNDARWLDLRVSVDTRTWLNVSSDYSNVVHFSSPNFLSCIACTALIFRVRT